MFSIFRNIEIFWIRNGCLREPFMLAMLALRWISSLYQKKKPANPFKYLTHPSLTLFISLFVVFYPFFMYPSPNTPQSSCVDVADTNASTAAAATASTSSLDEPDAAADLINLDTTNSSFELEDFDPLNDRARPIPSAAKPPPTTPSALTTATAAIAPSSGFNNPIYPYFTPTHLHAKAPQHHQHSLSQGGNHFHHQHTNGGLGSGSGAGVGRAASVQDDFELLRNYGLDKFSLIDGAGGDGGQEKQHQHLAAALLGSTSPVGGAMGGTSSSSTRAVKSFVNGAGRASSSRTAAFSNWTTFDW